MSDSDDIRRILAECSSDNPLTRHRARQSLAELGESAVEPLIGHMFSGGRSKGMDDRSRAAAADAARALAAIGEPSVPGLTVVLSDPDVGEEHREWVAFALASIGSEEAMRVLAESAFPMSTQVLEALASSSRPEVVEIVKSHITEHGDPTGYPSEKAVRFLVDHAGPRAAAEALTALGRRMKESDEILYFSRVVGGLARMGAEGVPCLVELFEGSPELYRVGDISLEGDSLIQMLAQSDRPEAVDLLVDIACYAGFNLNLNAVRALLKLRARDASAWRRILSSSAGSQGSLRCHLEVALAVAELGLAELLPELKEAYDQELAYRRKYSKTIGDAKEELDALAEAIERMGGGPLPRMPVTGKARAADAGESGRSPCNVGSGQTSKGGGSLDGHSVVVGCGFKPSMVDMQALHDANVVADEGALYRGDTWSDAEDGKSVCMAWALHYCEKNGIDPEGHEFTWSVTARTGRQIGVVTIVRRSG